MPRFSLSPAQKKVLQQVISQELAGQETGPKFVKKILDLVLSTGAELKSLVQARIQTERGVAQQQLTDLDANVAVERQRLQDEITALDDLDTEIT